MNDNLLVLTTTDEAIQCAKLMSSSEPWITLKRDYERCLRIFLDRSHDIILEKEGEAVTGFCIVQTNRFPQPYISVLAVHQDHRGKGLGTKLIQYAEQKYYHINQKMYIAVSSFNDKARRLYESLGYTAVGEFKDYAVAGRSEIMLERLLRPLTQTIPNADVYASGDLKDMDIDFIHNNLKTLYWATNVTRENVIGRMMNSMNFGVFAYGRQVGFARVITDYFSFAYLADVFVEEPSRGNGYSRILMEYIIDYPVLRNIKWLLATRDMQGLYTKFGFTPVNNPSRFMGLNGWKSF